MAGLILITLIALVAAPIVGTVWTLWWVTADRLSRPIG